MIKDIKIDKELNFASSIILYDIVAEKFNTQLSKIVISNDGFYIEFHSSDPISSNDLDAIEKTCLKKISLNKEIVLSNKEFALNKYEQYFKDENKELKNIFYCYDKTNIFNFGYELSVPYETKKIHSFKLLSLGGTKWLNDDHNETLIRINGIAFSNKDEAKEWLIQYQDKKERDHRKIGEELKIFTLNPLAGQGLPIWLPRGFALRDTLSKFINKTEFKYHFEAVATPILGSVELYKTSGHYAHYKQNMFPEMHLADGESLILRPMTCPHHVLVYKNEPKSYKDLPLRLSEDSILHRYEASGGLTGLERVRMMDLADIHIFARHDQIKSEIKRTYEMLKEIHSILGIEFSSVDLSLHDPKDKEKFFDNKQMWQSSENQLREALKELNVPFKEEVGEAAFYGPKIDFQAKTALGHIVTVSTIQLDFLLPDRFKLTYKNKDNNEEIPVMIHVSAIGTYERFVAVLLEQTKGKLPLWLSPDQVIIIPINSECYEYANEIDQKLRQNLIRTVIDTSDERLSKKIREAQIKKIPYQIVIGKDEVLNKNLTIRKYGEEQTLKMSLNEFIDMLNKQIKEYK